MLGHLLISNGSHDGAIIAGAFEPATPDDGRDNANAARLELTTAGGVIELEGDAAVLLFAYYSVHGQHLGGVKSDYLPISRQAVETLQDEMAYSPERSRSDKIIKNLAARL